VMIGEMVDGEMMTREMILCRNTRFCVMRAFIGEGDNE